MASEVRPKPVTECSKCRSCGAEVFWVVWRESGKRMPVDAQISPTGDLALTLSGGPYGTLWVDGYRAEEHGLTRRRYTSHFGTCPGAASHRKADTSNGGSP